MNNREPSNGPWTSSELPKYLISRTSNNNLANCNLYLNLRNRRTKFSSHQSKRKDQYLGFAHGKHRAHFEILHFSQNPILTPRCCATRRLLVPSLGAACGQNLLTICRYVRQEFQLIFILSVLYGRKSRTTGYLSKST